MHGLESQHYCIHRLFLDSYARDLRQKPNNWKEWHYRSRKINKLYRFSILHDFDSATCTCIQDILKQFNAMDCGMFLCQVNTYYQNTDSLLTNIVWSLMCYVVCTVQCEKESHEFDTGMQFRSDSLVQVVYDDPFKCYFQFQSDMGIMCKIMFEEVLSGQLL